MPPPSKSFWAFYRQSVADSRSFLQLLAGGFAVIPVVTCWQLPSLGPAITLLRVLVSWAGLESILFGLTVLLVWVDYSESKSRKQPAARNQRRQAAEPSRKAAQ